MSVNVINPASLAVLYRYTDVVQIGLAMTVDYFYSMISERIVNMLRMAENRRFFGTSILTAFLSIILVAICLITNHWEHHSYDMDCVASRNASSSDTVIIRHVDFISVTVPVGNHTDYYPIGGAKAKQNQRITYHLHDQNAGIWSLCNHLSGKVCILFLWLFKGAIIFLLISIQSGKE